jgi:hypothetical protein
MSLIFISLIEIHLQSRARRTLRVPNAKNVVKRESFELITATNENFTCKFGLLDMQIRKRKRQDEYNRVCQGKN